MQQLRKSTFFLFALLAGIVSAVYADNAGEVYLFHRPSFKTSPADMPKSQRSGEVTLVGGLKVPAYSLSMASGVQEGQETFTPKTRDLNVKVTPELASQLDAYAYPLGIILVPRSWAPRVAGVGADGSMYMVFAPDTSGQSYLSFRHTAACVGCAYSNASLHFKEARALARQNGFLFYQEPDIFRTVTLNRFQKAYSLKMPDGNPVDGVVYFDADNNFLFYEAEISAPASQHAIATTILNQFVWPKNSQ